METAFSLPATKNQARWYIFNRKLNRLCTAIIFEKIGGGGVGTAIPAEVREPPGGGTGGQRDGPDGERASGAGERASSEVRPGSDSRTKILKGRASQECETQPFSIIKSRVSEPHKQRINRKKWSGRI